MEAVLTVLCWMLVIFVIFPALFVGAIAIAAGVSASFAFIWLYGFVMELLGRLVRKLTKHAARDPIDWDATNHMT